MRAITKNQSKVLNCFVSGTTSLESIVKETGLTKQQVKNTVGSLWGRGDLNFGFDQPIVEETTSPVVEEPQVVVEPSTALVVIEPVKQEEPKTEEKKQEKKKKRTRNTSPVNLSAAKKTKAKKFIKFMDGLEKKHSDGTVSWLNVVTSQLQEAWDKHSSDAFKVDVGSFDNMLQLIFAELGYEFKGYNSKGESIVTYHRVKQHFIDNAADWNLLWGVNKSPRLFDLPTVSTLFFALQMGSIFNDWQKHQEKNSTPEQMIQQILNAYPVDKTFDLSDKSKAFKSLKQTYHPDKATGNSNAFQWLLILEEHLAKKMSYSEYVLATSALKA